MALFEVKKHSICVTRNKCHVKISCQAKLSCLLFRTPKGNCSVLGEVLQSRYSCFFVKNLYISNIYANNAKKTRLFWSSHFIYTSVPYNQINIFLNILFLSITADILKKTYLNINCVYDPTCTQNSILLFYLI